MSLDLGTVSGKIDLDVIAFEQKYARVDAAMDKLEQSGDVKVKVDADTTRAESAVESFVGGVLDGMKDASVDVDVDTAKAEKAIDAVESTLEEFKRREYDPKVDVDIEKSELRIADLKRELDVLGRMDASPKVKADTERAERDLDAAQTRLRALQGMRAEMEVVADTSQAEGALDDIEDEAVKSGKSSGDGMGKGMVAGILAGLASIPIAGAVVKVGQAIAGGLIQGIQDGFGQEVTRDLFSARTGLDEATAARFATAAGNAYADAFGESVESNLDLARHALQLGLIDADATNREVEKIISKIDSLAMLSEEDARRVATAVDVMVSTGIVKSADEAFDVLLAGFQQGVDSGEDLLDTMIEYPALFDRLGLSAEEAMGLMNQGLEAGARNSDFVADALKEFQIRATDASEASAKGFERIGLDAEEMTAKIAKGGEGAKEGLDQVLDGLRNMTDPVERNAAGVELFGTKWEDLGDAMLALDVTTAVSSLGQVEGALDTAMAKLADNPATAVESAKRNIEVAVDGIKVALAGAFSEPLQDVGEWVQGNRAGVLEFLGGIANGFFDAGRAAVEFAASALEAMGDFVEYGIVQTILATDNLIEVLSALGVLDVDTDFIDDMVFGLRDVRWGAYEAADGMREGLITNGIDPIQERFNEGLDTAVLEAQVHDASAALQGSIGEIGSSLEGLGSVDIGLDGKFSTATEAGALLDAQLRAAVASIGDVQVSAAAAGESQASLTDRWHAGRDALVAQLEALGYTREEALALAEAYGAVPEQIETSAYLDAAPAYTALGDLVIEVDSATGTITVNGDATPASATLGELVGNVDASDGTVTINGNKLPADMTLEQLLGVIGGSAETVTINGNDYPADQVRRALLGKISASSANVNIGANTYSATSALDAMIRSYNGRVMTVYTMMRTIGQAPVATGGDVDAHAAAAMGATRLAGGGQVIGPGTGTSDEVPAAHPSGVRFWLSNGEHVLTADDVLDLGGQQGAYALRAMIQAGMVKPLSSDRGMAGGGAVGTSPAAARSGPVTAVLAAQDRELLAAVASRPVSVRVGSREVARATREGEQSWGARSTWGHETTTLPGGGRL